MLTIDAQGQSRILNIKARSGDFAVEGMTLTGGKTSGEYVNRYDTSHNGGAIRSLSSGILSINDSVIRGNSATDEDKLHLGGGELGGGIFAVGNVMLNSSTISDNSTPGSGGGIFALGNVSVDSSTINRNSSGFKYSGGGIEANGAVSVTGSTISGNSSGDGGGISVGGQVTVTSSTISGNSADGCGGGIQGGNSVRVISSTITGNTANGDFSIGECGGPPPRRYCGGIRSAGDLTIHNSIVAGNTYRSASGNIEIHSGTLAIEHSLIDSNEGANLAEAPVGSPDAGGNFIGGDVHGIIDPRLAPLADNGGPTKTHALLPDSPAMDAGDLSAVAGENGVPEFDQRGMGFDRVSGGRIDMGAFEVVAAAEASTEQVRQPLSRSELRERNARRRRQALVDDRVAFEDYGMSRSALLLAYERGELKQPDNFELDAAFADVG